MVAPATAAASDIRRRAKTQVDSAFAFLASAKNTPAFASDLTVLANLLLLRADEGTLRQIADPQDKAFSQALLLNVNESLDWIAARNIVKLFAHAAKLELSATELQTLIDGLLATMKSRQNRPFVALRWPEGPVLDAIAIEWARRSAPQKAAEIAAALTEGFRALELEWFEPVLREGG